MRPPSCWHPAAARPRARSSRSTPARRRRRSGVVSDARRALAPARVVPQPRALEPAAGGPDRQLVGDDHGLVAARPRRGRRRSPRSIRAAISLVRLAPGGPERVDQPRPVTRVAQRAVADAERLALEVVARLDHAVVGGDRQAVRRPRSAPPSPGPAPASEATTQGDVAGGQVVGRPARPSAGRARTGGSRAAGRRARPRGCGPHRGAAGARPWCRRVDGGS